MLTAHLVDDTIRMENAIFTVFATGALAADRFVIGTAARDANDNLIYNSATGALLYDSDGTGAATAIQFATLAPGLALTSLDFVIVGRARSPRRQLRLFFHVRRSSTLVALQARWSCTLARVMNCTWRLPESIHHLGVNL